MVVGYKLISVDDASVVQSWGGVWGQCPSPPNPIYLPNGDHVHVPEIGVDYSGYSLTEWVMEPPALTSQDFATAIQTHIDAIAKTRDYGDGVSLASYASSTVPGWAAEATTFIAWRDAVWAYAYQEMAKVEQNLRPTPTISELISELPTITWPS